MKYWFHSGKEFTSKIEWTTFDNEVKKQICQKNYSKAKKKKQTGKYTITPVEGPSPCGRVIWLCKGKEYTSPAAYKTSSCGKPKPTPKPSPPPKKPDRCKPPYFNRDKRCEPEYNGWPSFDKNHKRCKCP